MDKILLIDAHNQLWRASIGFGPQKQIHTEYLAGDSYGYDRVECLEINPKETPYGFYGVKIRYLDSGETDIWFEDPDSSYSTYVEPLGDR